MNAQPVPDRYSFTANAVQFFWDKPSLSIAAIKEIAGVIPTYATFQQLDPAKPWLDQWLSDQNAVDLRTNPEFYFVPQGTN